MFRIWIYTPANKKNCEASVYRREADILRGIMVQRFVDIIEEGKVDGSINKNLDTKKAVFFGLFSSTSLLNMISSLEKSFWISQGLDEDDFIQFSLDLLADALK